jgi:RNA polymerase sigma-70 factor (ECF subfamily)
VNGLTDEELVAQCRRGSREAYAELTRRHARLVFAVCLGVLGDVSDSEDAAQEALIRGFTGIGDLRRDERFSAWITRIARNHCIDLIRTAVRRRELLDQELGRSSGGAEPAPIFQNRGNEQPRSGDRRSYELQSALGRLDEKYRLPLLLYYFEGRSTGAVAETLGISEAGVLTRLSRARKELRRRLARTGDPDRVSGSRRAG